MSVEAAQHEDGSAVLSLKIVDWQAWTESGGLHLLLACVFCVLALVTRLTDIAMPDSIA